MSLHSEYGYSNPNAGVKMVIHNIPCYRGCGKIVKRSLLPGDMPSKWNQCGACGTKADNGGFNSVGSV